jgi:hypothetical protein
MVRPSNPAFFFSRLVSILNRPQRQDFVDERAKAFKGSAQSGGIPNNISTSLGNQNWAWAFSFPELRVKRCAPQHRKRLAPSEEPT